MKNYIIECNEEQLRLLRSAVELQMRVRIGQGWAITENILSFGDADYRDVKEHYDRILDEVLRNVAYTHPQYGKLRECVSRTREEERDMWVSLENALGMRTGEIALGMYGLMKISEAKEKEE